MVVISPTKSRKKGKAAPATIAAKDPTMRSALSHLVVCEKREKKGAGGSFGAYSLTTSSFLTYDL